MHPNSAASPHRVADVVGMDAPNTPVVERRDDVAIRVIRSSVYLECELGPLPCSQ